MQNKRIFFSVITFLVVAGFIASAFYFFKNTHKKAEKRVSATLTIPVTSAGGGHGHGKAKSAPISSVSVTGTIGRVTGSGTQETQPVKTGNPLDPQAVSNALVNIRTLVNKREYSEALKAVDDLLSMEIPEGVRERTLLERTRLLATLDRKPEAIEVLSALLESATGAAVVHQALAKYFILCRDTGVLAQHLANREAEMQDDPDNLRILRILTGLYEYSHMPQQELSCRERLDAKGQDIENLKRLLELYKASSNVASMASTLTTLAVIEPANANAYLLEKARLEFRTGERETARRTIDQLVVSPSLDFGARIQIGLLQYDMADYDKAVFTFETCGRQATRGVDQELCLFGLMRTRIKRGPANDADLNVLRNLAANSQSISIKTSAANLLKQVGSRGLER